MPRQLRAGLARRVPADLADGDQHAGSPGVPEVLERAEPVHQTGSVSPAARAFLGLAERRLAEFGEGVLYAGVAGESA